MASPDDKIDVSSTSFYALHVALQTLKERCQNLQQRLTTIEDENEMLRRSSGMDTPKDCSTGDNEAYLRVMVGDLMRQKTQLTDHIAMVTKENRLLWSKLSKLTKENSSLGLNITKIREAINASPVVTGQSNSSASTRSSSNNLIRSKTFTRPTPKLRDRQQVDEDGKDEEETNMSLEEISLQIINKLVEGKENFKQKCGEILDTPTSDNLCFGFVKGVPVDACEETVEKCTTESKELKDSLIQQQNRLKELIQNLSDKKSKRIIEPQYAM